MSNDLTIFSSGVSAQRSSVFGQVQGYEGKLSAGVGVGFATIRFKGGRWAIKHQGEVKPLLRYTQHPATGQMINDGPQPFLDCVIIDVAEHPTKTFYEGVYQEGDNNPPDCWSANGIRPDSGSPKPQSQTCVGCKWNGWGTKITSDGRASRGKQCSDHKRLAVVPVSDIENKVYGGAMLLQVPPTSLKALVPFEKRLAQAGLRFFEVWTRIRFADNTAFPLMEFDAMAPLNDQQAQQVVKMMEDPMIDRILNAEISGVEDTAQLQPDPVPLQATATPQPVAPQPMTGPAPNDGGRPLPSDGFRPTVAAPQPAPMTPPSAQAAAEPVRPPGMTDVEWNQYKEFLASRAAGTVVQPQQPQAEKAPTRRRTSRTQPVTPSNSESQPNVIQMPAPQPMTAQPATAPQPVTLEGNATAVPPNGEDPAAKIGAALKTLL